MLKCFFFKRKFFEYCEGKLSERDCKKMRRHIDECRRCRELFETVGRVERVHKDVPKQSETFWHNFSVELNQRLDKRGAKKLWRPPTFTVIPKPAVAFAVAAMVLLTFVFIMPQFNNKYVQNPLVSTPDALFKEVLLLEDVTGVALLNHNEDAYFDEIELFYELDQEVG